MSNKDKFRALIERWAHAVTVGNRKAILAHHSPDIVMFDFPNEIRGRDAYDKTWDFFLANPRGKIVFEPKHAPNHMDDEQHRRNVAGLGATPNAVPDHPVQCSPGIVRQERRLDRKSKEQ
jgi:hypothetical protein